METHHFWKPAACVLLGLVLSAPAAADYKSGLDALAIRDYARARAQFEGDPDNALAVVQLARMARLGLGEPANPAREAGLLERAAELGNDEAKFQFAIGLAIGRGLAADVPRAVKLMQELDAAGHLDATVYLGRAYRFGWFAALPQDDDRSAVLLKKAADSNHLVGLAFYGLALLEGRGVPADPVQGLALMKRAADEGSSVAQMQYARVLTAGTGGIAKDEAAGLALYRKVGELGDASAQFAVGLAYLNGQGVDRSEETAARWFDAAARQGEAWAQVRLGDLFRFGRGVPRLRTQAYYWYTVATKADNSAAGFARERRAQIAGEMAAADIETQTRRAEAFQPQPGLRPRQEALPTLARGDRLSLGSASIVIPAPAGYVNSGDMFDMVARLSPNDPSLQPRLMVLTLKDDLDRLKLRLPSPLRSVEILRETTLEGDITPAVFADLRKDFRARLEAGTQAGRYKLEGVVRDDENAYAIIRSSTTGGKSTDAFAMVSTKGRVLTIAFTGFENEHLPELRELVASMVNELLSRNRGFSLFGSNHQ